MEKGFSDLKVAKRKEKKRARGSSSTVRLPRLLYDSYFLFSSLPKFAQKISHFGRFFLGPSLTNLQKNRHFRHFWKNC